jgi:hypothetical protein
VALCAPDTSSAVRQPKQRSLCPSCAVFQLLTLAYGQPMNDDFPASEPHTTGREPRPRRHPAIPSREELTFGQRAADTLRNGMGSWGFVIAALVFIGGWMLGNRGVGFDKYPFILLNLILSCLAAMQGAILLIAAKREDQISSDLAAHDYATNVEADQIVKSIHQLTTEIHASICLPAGRPPTAR